MKKVATAFFFSVMYIGPAISMATTWPSASNTGVPAGVTLRPSGGITINTPGVTISGLNITGPVYINAANVTLENCKITSAGFAVVQIASGATGVVVQDCEINGVGTNNDGSNGISGQGTFLRNNIYNVENGINVTGDHTVIQDNYIHNLLASGSPHYDGIQIDGGSNDTISHNTIINDYGQTSAVMIDNYFGPVSNISVDNNVLVGGGYTVYSDGQFSGGSITGVSFTNNHLGGGQWGDTDFNNNTPIYTGNVDDGLSIVNNLSTATSTTSTGTSGTTSTSGTTTGTTSGTTTTTTTTTTPITLTGTDSADHLTATNHDTILLGKGGNDVLVGGTGNDTLIGGTGADVMTGGGGNDHFVFNGVSEMGNSNWSRDVITDFVQGQDKIDLSAIDASSTASGNNAFTFLSADHASFTHTAGELEFRTDTSHNRTIIQGDINGDGVHDFQIQLTGIVHLTAADFIL